MLTASGRLVMPGSDVAPTLEDVARALGRTVRWRGQPAGVISVLAHSLTVSTLIRTPETKIHGLLHDAGEIIADIPTTWKTYADREREAELLELIYESLELDPPTEAQKVEVHRADLMALVAEAYVLGHSDVSMIERQAGISLSECEDAIAITEVNVDFTPELFQAATAERVFRQAFELLSKGDHA